LGLCPRAFSLNPSLDVSQYAHSAWKIRDGFVRGRILSIAQTPDGYLWLGTELGLVRFDGVRAVPWTPPGDEHLPSDRVWNLMCARDGTLWIGTEAGLASWNGAKLARYAELEGYRVQSLLEDHEGTTWVGAGTGAPPGRLCGIKDGNTRCYGQDGSLGRGVQALYEDGTGNLWALTDLGLWRWKPVPPKRYDVPQPLAANSLYGYDGKLLISTNAGFMEIAGGKAVPYRIGGIATPVGAKLLRDRDGGMWIGTVGQGLVHLHRGRTDVFSLVDGLSANDVWRLFEDREGNVWAATYEGLDRFRELPAFTVSVKQGLSSTSVFSALAARDGSVWVAARAGLDRWKDGMVQHFRRSHGLPDDYASSLFEDSSGRIWAGCPHGLAWFDGGRFLRAADVVNEGAVITEDAGVLWASDGRGLLHILDGRVVEEFPGSRIGIAAGRRANPLVADRRHGGLWFGVYGGGTLAYFQGGEVRKRYTVADGLVGALWDLQSEPDGKLWASTSGGLSLTDGGHITTLTSKNGLPCDLVFWKMEDNDHATWLYTSCGLVRITRGELAAWVANPKHKVQATLIDGTEGVELHSAPVSSLTPRVSKSPDGKLWFLAGGGVSVIDPRHLPFNKLPPPVHIEQVIADRNVISDRRLPALTRDLEIQYTALSLIAPEKNRFKYKLEGYDRDWVDAGNRRQAFYTNLPPRKYRFRVMACNNSGVWNEEGDNLEFSIAPAFYQTNWFLAACAAGFLLLIWAGYWWRLRQVRRESRKLREVVETIPAYVWSAEPDGSVDFVNRRWLEFSGLSPDQARGWGWADALHPEDRGGLIESWRTAVASGNPMDSEARMRDAGGQYRWLAFRAVPLRNGSGRIVKWYGKTTDIENEKRVQQLESDMAHFGRVSMMGELAASVAHEVNQPLTGIVSNGSACLRLLAGDTPNVEEAREAVGDIVRDGKRAGEVIARIRAMTKRATTPRERLDANEVIREVLVLVTDEAKKNHVVIKTQFADDLVAVSGDRVQLQQVVLNLAINAIQAMGSVEESARELVIHTRNVEGGQVQVTVEDSGVGVDSEKMTKIFEPFYTTKSGGMGMGLSICRSIVQNHGGRLWATANEGPGMSFHFSLPQYNEEEQNARASGV
jgi:PAS domain S-box-containing protein